MNADDIAFLAPRIVALVLLSALLVFGIGELVWDAIVQRRAGKRGK